MKKLISTLAVLLCSIAAAQTPQYVPRSGGTMTGPLNVPTLNNVVKADRAAGADMCAKINTAAKTITSGIVDARGFVGAQSCAADPFPGVTGTLALLLGPVSVTSTATWTIPSGLHLSLWGQGAAVTSLTFTPVAGTNNAISVQSTNDDLGWFSVTGSANIARLIDARGSGVSGTRIHHLSLSTAGFIPGAGPNAAIALGLNANDQWVTDNTITNIGICGSVWQSSYDIVADNASAPGNLRIHVRNNQISGSCTNTSIALFQVTDSDMIGNRVDQNNKIRSDTSTSGGYGLMAYSTLGIYVQNVIIANNNIRNTAGAGIYSQVCRYCTIIGNTLNTTGQQEIAGSLLPSGIEADGSEGTVISGNVIRNATVDGIGVVANFCSITNVAVNVNVATITCPNFFYVGEPVNVQTAGHSAINGRFVVASTTGSAFTFAITTANIASVADTGYGVSDTPAPTVTSNQVYGAGRYCAFIGDVYNLTFSQNTLSGCTNVGINLTGLVGNSKIEGNVLSSLSAAGIGSVASLLNVQFKGNFVTNWPTGFAGLSISPGAPLSIAQNVTIEDNHFSSTAATAYATDIAGATSGLMKGNMFRGSTICAWIDSGSSGWVVEGNYLQNCATGIYTLLSSGSNQVQNNHFISNTTPLNLNAGDTHDGNQVAGGPLNGSSVLVAGTKTVSNTEIRTGDAVILTHCAAGGTLGTLSLGTIVNGTSFVINSSSGTDTSTVCWTINH